MCLGEEVSHLPCSVPGFLLGRLGSLSQPHAPCVWGGGLPPPLLCSWFLVGCARKSLATPMLCFGHIVRIYLTVYLHWNFYVYQSFYFWKQCSQVIGAFTPDLAGSFLQRRHSTSSNFLNIIWPDPVTLLPPSVLNLLHLLSSIKKYFQDLSLQRSLIMSVFNLDSENFFFNI